MGRCQIDEFGDCASDVCFAADECRGDTKGRAMSIRLELAKELFRSHDRTRITVGDKRRPTPWENISAARQESWLRLADAAILIFGKLEERRAKEQ